MARRRRQTIVQLLLWLTAIAPLAQHSEGTLSGHVFGPDSQVLANICVTAISLATGHRASGATGHDGRFTIRPLEPGAYRLEIGCAAVDQKILQVFLQSGEQKDISISINASQAQVRSAVVPEGMSNAKSVSNLPSNGRDLTQVETLQAGVSSVKTQPEVGNIESGRGQRGFGAQFSISGSRPQQNSYILNGISINDYANSAPGSVLGITLGADAIQQLTISTDSYQAEFGRSSGGIVDVVTRPGGDTFHGSAYEFLRNSALDARNYFDVVKPPFRRNQYGIAAGSAALHRRLHLFVNYEGLRQSLGLTNFDIVPSQAARHGVLAESTVQVDPQAARYLAFFPLPNRGLIGNGDIGNFAFAGQQVTPETYFATRLDATPRKTDTLSGAYVLDDSKTTQPDPFGMRLNEITTDRQVLSLLETHAFSHAVSNAARFGVSRVVAATGLTPTALQPIAADTSYGFVPGRTSGGINIAGLTNFTGGLGAASPYHFHWTSIQFYDDMSYMRGRNLYRTGAAIERMRDNMLSDANPNGDFTFNSLSDFLTNRPYLLTIALSGPPTPRDLHQMRIAAYAQDDAHINGRLTANAGLRYEMTTVPTEVAGRLSALRKISSAAPHLGDPFFGNPTLLNFEPRLGVAWDTTGTGLLVLRSGFALFDVLPLPYEFELLTNDFAPFFEGATPSDLPTLSFPYQAVQLAKNLASLRYAYIEPKPRRNYVAAWNLSMGVNPTRTASVLIGYVGSRGVHQPFRVDDANLVLPTLTAQGLTWPLPVGSGTKVNPSAGSVDMLMWRGDSFFNGFQARAQAAMGSTLDIHVAYTWSKSLDNGSATIAGDQFSNSISSLPWYDLRRNWGRSDFDVTQNLSAYATYRFWPSKHEAHNWWLKGWRVVSTYQASSGSPFTPTIAGDPLGTRSTDPFDVPNRVDSGNCSNPVNPRRPLDYFRLECFQFPGPANVMGNLGRNSVMGPGLWTLDSALFKESQIPRILPGFTVQLRIEAFNVLNCSNLAPPLDHRAIFDALGEPINGAGQIDTTNTPSRQIQLGLKLGW